MLQNTGLTTGGALDKDAASNHEGQSSSLESTALKRGGAGEIPATEKQHLEKRKALPAILKVSIPHLGVSCSNHEVAGKTPLLLKQCLEILIKTHTATKAYDC